MEVFAAEVQAGLAPLLNNAYEDAKQLDEEIELVARILEDSAERHLPLNGQEGGKTIHSVAREPRAGLLILLGNRLVVYWKVHFLRKRID